MDSLKKSQIEIIIKAQQQLIDNPKRAVVNSESAFVMAIIDEVDSELARIYWNWTVCKILIDSDKLFNDATIIANQKILNKIDLESKMPDWGYYGT